MKYTEKHNGKNHMVQITKNG